MNRDEHTAMQIERVIKQLDEAKKLLESLIVRSGDYSSMNKAKRKRVTGMDA